MARKAIAQHEDSNGVVAVKQLRLVAFLIKNNHHSRSLTSLSTFLRIGVGYFVLNLRPGVITMQLQHI